MNDRCAHTYMRLLVVGGRKEGRIEGVGWLAGWLIERGVQGGGGTRRRQPLFRALSLRCLPPRTHIHPPTFTSQAPHICTQKQQLGKRYPSGDSRSIQRYITSRCYCWLLRTSWSGRRTARVGGGERKEGMDRSLPESPAYSSYTLQAPPNGWGAPIVPLAKFECLLYCG